MFDRFSQLFTKAYGIYLDIVIYKSSKLTNKYEKKRASLKYFSDHLILLIENEKLQIFYAEIINFNFKNCIIEFFLIIDQNEKSIKTFHTAVECSVENFKITFIEKINMVDFIKYFKKPLVEYKCDYLIYNRKYDRYDGKRPMAVSLYKLEDFRINLETISYFNKIFSQIPFIENTLYIKTDSIDRCTASTQFFIQKDERSFVFIREDALPKKLIFREALDFLNFNSLYINSLGDGYFSLRNEIEEESNSSNQYEILEWTRCVSLYEQQTKK